MLSMGTCNPRQTKAYIIEILEAGLFPFVRSSPGIGKSSIYAQVAKLLNLHMIDHRLSTSAPEDLSGLPTFFEVEGEDGVFRKVAKFVPFDELFPIEGTPIPKGKNGWLIFLDEFNSCEKPVMAAAYKLVLDRMTGQQRLHSNTAMGGAGNHDTDRAITNPISTAMQSRVVHIHMIEDFDCWLKDVAIPNNYDSRIIAFLSQYPKKLMDFRPEHNDKTFCCPRTWEFMNRMIKDKPVTPDKIPLYGGTITSGEAANFVTFVETISEMINWKDIVRDPHGLDLPTRLETKWATVTHMAENIDEENIEPLATYANRFLLDFKVLFFRMVMQQQPKLRTHPAMRKAIVELAKYLND